MCLLVVSMLLVFGFTFIMTDSFSRCHQFFLKNQPPVFPGILENSVSMKQNQYKIICQNYKNHYRFATLYDIKNKIPLFSAYKYTGLHTEDVNRPKWRTEPQLDDLKAGMSEALNNGDNKNLDRGHLFPCSHAADEDTFKSTFILTNAVPQYKSFNSGSWNRMEQKVRIIMDSHCRDENNSGNILAYVLTGAVPSQTTPLNKGVNIPSHMWTAFCCYNIKSKSLMSQAHLADNIDESKEKGKTISAQPLQELQIFLESKYSKESVLFNGGCLDFLKVDVSPLPDQGTCDVQDDDNQSWGSYFKNMWPRFWDWLRSYFG